MCFEVNGPRALRMVQVMVQSSNAAKQSRILTNVVESLSQSTTLEEITDAVARAARKLAGADGATFVLRDGDKCYYADEQAISPLWQGRRFPLEACISGWCMLNRKVVTIEDIYEDERIPHDAYRPTFVRSLCMVPIGVDEPIGAIGSYWSSKHTPAAEDIKLLKVLANSSAVALQNLDLKQKLQKHSIQYKDLADQKKDLELAIHSIVHDLKSPMAAMMAFIQVLQGRLVGQVDETTLQLLDSILLTGQRTHNQIDTMLGLYAITNREPRKQEVDLSRVCSDLLDQFAQQQPNRPLRTKVDPNMTVYADPHLLRLAMENLIGNAVKYAAKREVPEIEVLRSSSGKTLPTFVVRDNGEGFDQDDAHKLFKPLSRLHAASDYAGTGLGLVSVARVIAMHGGKIWAEGKKQKGANFYFQLPPAGGVI